MFKSKEEKLARKEERKIKRAEKLAAAERQIAQINEDLIQLKAKHEEDMNQVKHNFKEKNRITEENLKEKNRLTDEARSVRHFVISIFEHANKKTKEEGRAIDDYNRIVVKEAGRTFKSSMSTISVRQTDVSREGNEIIAKAKQSLDATLDEITSRYSEEWKKMDTIFLDRIKSEDPEFIDELSQIPDRKKMYRTYQKLKELKLKEQKKNI